MHEYEITFDTDSFFSTTGLWYSTNNKKTLYFTYEVDTSLLKYVVPLKDEITDDLYWVTKYCLKYMSVTADNRYVKIGPDVKHYDTAGKQFCIGDYSNMCTPAGPFKNLLDFYKSLPIYVTIHSPESFSEYTSKKTFDDGIKHVIPYDDNNKIELDRNDHFVCVSGSIRPMLPNYQCVKYHYIPLSTMFHVDVIFETLENKIVKYYNEFKTYITEKISYMLNIISQKISYYFTRFVENIFYFIFNHHGMDISIIFIYLMSTETNYTTTAFTIIVYLVIKKILF